MACEDDPVDDSLVCPFLAAGGVLAADTVLTADPADPNLAAWALLAVLVWAGWYLLACALFPWRACTWCDGGKRRDSSRQHWRDCRHCAGSGRRPRIGRRVWTALSRDNRR